MSGGRSTEIKYLLSDRVLFGRSLEEAFPDTVQKIIALITRPWFNEGSWHHEDPIAIHLTMVGPPPAQKQLASRLIPGSLFLVRGGVGWKQVAQGCLLWWNDFLLRGLRRPSGHVENSMIALIATVADVLFV